MTVYIWTSWELEAAYIGEVTWWKPWANTIVYYPFENDYADQMGNTVLSASWTKDTIGYTFTISGNSKITNGNATWKTALANQVFVSYWIKVNSYWSITQFPDATKDFFYDFYHTSSSYRKKWEYRPNSWSATYFWSASTTTWTRYYFAYWYDDWKIYAYFNWEQVGSATVGVPRTWVPRNVVSASNGCNFTISQLIGESVCRTAEEILNYYNKTKWTYWL